MAKSQKKQKEKIKYPVKRSSKILYTVAIIVVVIPILLLGYIYITTKENKGTPTVGSRFDDELTTKITSEDVQKVKDALVFDNAESVEVNLTSATLRITVDMKDDSGSDAVDQVLKQTYDKINELLPVKTYFTNQDTTKMYDLDIHVYNFIPTDDQTDGWVYKEMVKNAANKKTVTDTLSSPKDKQTVTDIENRKESK